MSETPNERSSWAQQPGETNRWFERFERFLRLGVQRTLLGVYNQERAVRSQNPARAVPGRWNYQVSEFEWLRRSEAFDKHRANLDRLRWERRQRALREREWEVAHELFKKADAMLLFPVAKTTREDKDVDGRVIGVTYIEPVKWSVGDIGRLVAVASQMARLAAGLALPAVGPETLERVETADEAQKYVEAKQLLLSKLSAVAAGPGANGADPKPHGNGSAGAAL